jgi:hypothetical protein
MGVDLKPFPLGLSGIGGEGGRMCLKDFKLKELSAAESDDSSGDFRDEVDLVHAKREGRFCGDGKEREESEF